MELHYRHDTRRFRRATYRKKCQAIVIEISNYQTITLSLDPYLSLLYSIKDIQVEDAGDYECVAENALGRATATTNLRVFAEPVIELMPSETRLQFTEGDEVHVTCMASGVPNPTVQWKNNQSPQTYGVIPSLHGLYGQNTADLIIDSVSQSDAGVYTCVATSEAGSDEVSIAIDVQAKRGDIGERK